jgi:hypothetical protein
MEGIGARRQSRPLRGVTIAGWIVIAVCVVELLVLAGVAAEAGRRWLATVEGETAAVKVTTSLPADFPGDFPIYPRARIIDVKTVKGGFIASWTTHDPDTSVLSFYRAAFTAPGYVVTGESYFGPIGQIDFDRAGMSGELTTVRYRGRTTIQALVPTY